MSEKDFITCKNTKRKHFSSFGSCLSINTIFNAECKIQEYFYSHKSKYQNVTEKRENDINQQSISNNQGRVKKNTHT